MARKHNALDPTGDASRLLVALSVDDRRALVERATYETLAAGRRVSLAEVVRQLVREGLARYREESEHLPSPAEMLDRRR
jgi:hypothetical protein